MTTTERARHRRRRRVIAAAALIATTTVACDTAEHTKAPAATAGNLTNDDVVKLFHAAGETPAPKTNAAQRPKSKHLARTPVRVNGVPAVWLRLVQCEAHGDWSYGAPGHPGDPGYDEYEGGPNFVHSTWLRHGGAQFADHAYDATPLQQLVVAKRTLRAEGVNSWPVCGPKVGLELSDAA